MLSGAPAPTDRVTPGDVSLHLVPMLSGLGVPPGGVVLGPGGRARSRQATQPTVPTVTSAAAPSTTHIVVGDHDR